MACKLPRRFLRHLHVSNPPAVAASLGHAADGNDVGCIAHRQFAASRQVADGDVGGGHLHIELAQHLVQSPVIIHVALHLLEIAAGDAASIGQKIGNHKNATLVQYIIGLGSGGAIGSFGNEFDTRTYALDRLPP